MQLKTLVLLLLVCFSYSKAEEKDTGNILTPADEWTLYDDEFLLPNVATQDN